MLLVSSFSINHSDFYSKIDLHGELSGWKLWVMAWSQNGNQKPPTVIFRIEKIVIFQTSEVSPLVSEWLFSPSDHQKWSMKWPRDGHWMIPSGLNCPGTVHVQGNIHQAVVALLHHRLSGRAGVTTHWIVSGSRDHVPMIWKRGWKCKT